MFDLDKLQAAAEAATPGPWESDDNQPFSRDLQGIFAPGLRRYVLKADFDVQPDNAADAEYIAAANPAVILELVAAHSDVLEQGDELRKMLDSYTREYPQECNKRVAAEAARDAALARIARVEALHAKATIYELTAHYSPDDSRPFQDYCIECTADSTIAMIEDCEWDSDWPVVSYPCPTVRALTEGEPGE